MNFYDQNEKPLSLYEFLLLAFEARIEPFWLDVGNQRYLVTAEYAEAPKVQCNLFVAAEEQDRWTSLYSGEEEPRQWRGTPKTIAKKFVQQSTPIRNCGKISHRFQEMKARHTLSSVIVKPNAKPL
jgi:hypothetical protein